MAGGTSGALWGTLIGLLFLNPLAGMAIGAGIGAASGALAGKLSDYGIPDDFIKELGGTIKPNSSALFLLVQKVTADKVLPEDGGLQRPRAQDVAVSTMREKRLREALGRHGAELGLTKPSRAAPRHSASLKEGRKTRGPPVSLPPDQGSTHGQIELGAKGTRTAPIPGGPKSGGTAVDQT